MKIVSNDRYLDFRRTLRNPIFGSERLEYRDFDLLRAVLRFIHFADIRENNGMKGRPAGGAGIETRSTQPRGCRRDSRSSRVLFGEKGRGARGVVVTRGRFDAPPTQRARQKERAKRVSGERDAAFSVVRLLAGELSGTVTAKGEAKRKKRAEARARVQEEKGLGGLRVAGGSRRAESVALRLIRERGAD